tara:strand:- start:589 stop:765 length:177 start_codon:yes stop_codon:yes gene_type:complete
MTKRAIRQCIKEAVRKSFLITLIILPGSLLSVPAVIWVSKKLDVELISIDFKNKKKPN